MQHQVERLAVAEILLGLTVAMDGDGVAKPGKAAEQTPGPTFHTVHLRIERDFSAHLHHLLNTKTTAEFSGPT